MLALLFSHDPRVSPAGRDRCRRKESEMDEAKMKDVYHIAEDKEGNNRWTRIGAAFVNRDGSINAYLDVLPRDGKIHIRDRKPTNSKEKGKTYEAHS